MASTSSPATTKAFKARTVLLQLLKTRGFDVEEYEGSSIAEVHAMLQEKQMDMMLKNPTTGGKVYVSYSAIKALRVNNIYDLVEDLYSLEDTLSKDDELIIVAKDPPNETIQKVLKDMWSKSQTFITIFGLDNLQFNILNHTLVPPHRPLSNEEQKTLLEKYSVTDPNIQLPDISRFSPVAAAIGLRPGMVCEIMRPSRTAVSTPFYRICSP